MTIPDILAALSVMKCVWVITPGKHTSSWCDFIQVSFLCRIVRAFREFQCHRRLIRIQCRLVVGRRGFLSFVLQWRQVICFFCKCHRLNLEKKIIEIDKKCFCHSMICKFHLNCFRTKSMAAECWRMVSFLKAVWALTVSTSSRDWRSCRMHIWMRRTRTPPEEPCLKRKRKLVKESREIPPTATHRCAWSTVDRSLQSDWLGHRQLSNRPFYRRQFSERCRWSDKEFACCWRTQQSKARLRNDSGSLAFVAHLISAVMCWHCPRPSPVVALLAFWSWTQSSESCLCWCWPSVSCPTTLELSQLTVGEVSKMNDHCHQSAEESRLRLCTFLCFSLDPTSCVFRFEAQRVVSCWSSPCVGNTTRLDF